MARLLDFFPPLDVGNPETFIAGLVAVFAEYPPEVMERAIHPAHGVPARCERPSPKVCTDVCEAILREAMEHQQREEMLRDRHARRALPKPGRTAEQQAAIDKLVAEVRADLCIPEGARRSTFVPRPSDDRPIGIKPISVHGARVAADLAERARRRQTSGGE